MGLVPAAIEPNGRANTHVFCGDWGTHSTENEVRTIKGGAVESVRDRIHGIEGWLEDREAEALERYAKDRVVLEVGSYKGKSAVAMAPLAKEIICIDHFHPEQQGQGFAPDSESIRPELEQNTEPWQEKITIHELDSQYAVTLDWPKVGLLYVDGNHDYETILSDLGFMKHVKTGGYAAFHDFNWNGVQQALREVVEQDPLWKCVERVGGLVVYKRLKAGSKKKSFGRICLAIPHERFVYAEFFDDLTDLVSNGVREGDRYTKLRGLPTHRARNQLCRAFLQLNKRAKEVCDEPFGAICFIDSDMKFDPLTLEQLRSNPLNSEYDVLQAWYCTKYWPPVPVMMKVTNTNHAWAVDGWGFRFMHLGEWEWGDLVEVDGLGGGFTIIRTEVLEAIAKDQEPGREIFFKYVNDSSEDLWFCKQAIQKGFKLAVDTSVPIRHIRHSFTGHRDYMRWREGIEAGIYDKDGKHL
jgi:hypothetical protein